MEGFSTLTGKALYSFSCYSPINTHTDGGGATMQSAGLPIGSNSEFSFLPKETLTCAKLLINRQLALPPEPQPTSTSISLITTVSNYKYNDKTSL